MRAFYVCVLVASAVFGGSSCAFVQLKTTAVVVAPEQDRVALLDYEAVDTMPLTGTAILCILTGVYYGGACWAYAAVPYDDQERDQKVLARADAARLVPCARLIDIEVEAVGWAVERRWSAIKDGARVFTSDELNALCSRDPASTLPAPKPTKPTPSSMEEWLQETVTPTDPAG